MKTIIQIQVICGWTLLLITLFSCKQESQKKDKIRDNHDYPTISYLDLKLDENGQVILPSNPYILEFKNGKKKVIFCGVEHLSINGDIENRMYKEIEQRFFQFQPEISINEGGDISQNTYRSKSEALLKDGEIGLIKVLSDRLHIKTINGDPNVELEFSELLKQYSKGEFLAYIVTERLMWGLYGEQVLDEQEIEKRYTAFIEGYIIKEGKVQLSTQEKQFDFYKKNYKKMVGRAFSLNDLKPTNPFDKKGRFQEIGRKSKNIRDQYLLKTIDDLLDKHDKVFVVFGSWHLLTCKPGLELLIQRKR
jgi:hypothetical protein